MMPKRNVAEKAEQNKKTEKSGQSTNTSREGSANAEHQTELNKYFSIYIRDSDMEGRDAQNGQKEAGTRQCRQDTVVFRNFAVEHQIRGHFVVGYFPSNLRLCFPYNTKFSRINDDSTLLQ